MSTTTVVQPASSSSSPAAVAAQSTPLPKAGSLPFTLGSLKASLPKSVFQIDTPTSIYYFLRDYAFIAICYYIQPKVFEYGPIAIFIWMNVVGFLFWCLFVVGHDCGHGTFSTNPNINFLFGLLSHSPILVPFSGWQRSHFLHHSHHNDIDHDHSWKPINRTEYAEYVDDANNSIIGKINYFMRFSFGLLVLYPIYLLTENAVKSSGNHFNPFSRLFETYEQRVQSTISTICVLLSLSSIVYISPSFSWFILCYFIPYIIFCAWLDMVTFLHHTSTENKYYRNNEWSFLKGALSTIDRSYGPLIEHLHHNIGTHMIHHMFFTSIPHYNLIEANNSLKQTLGSYYKYDSTPFYQAFYDSMINCKYVSNEGKIVGYQNHTQYENETKQDSKKAA